MIIVRKNIISKPLLMSNDANLIEFYDPQGSLMSLLFRQFSDNMWMLVTKEDPDWETTLIRMGYRGVKQSPAEFIQAVKQNSE